MTEGMPTEMDELLDRIDAGWTSLMEAVQDMTEEEMRASSAGEWSVKDHLAHLTAWEQYLLSHYLQGQPAHEVMHLDESEFACLDEDAINAIIYERNWNRAVADVLTDLAQVHKKVVEILQGTDLAVLIRDRNLDPVIWNTYEHYEEHLQTIRARSG